MEDGCVTKITLLIMMLFLVKSELDLSSCENTMALLLLTHEHNESFCTGTRIQENTLLTAAHCISTKNGVLPTSNISIVFGNLLENQGNFSTEVTTIVVHEKFKNENNDPYDIAALTIETNFPFYPKRCKFDRDKTRVYMIGYVNGTEFSEVPLIKMGRIIKNKSEDCVEREPILWVEVEGENIPCFGDSGGPIFNNDGDLIGLISGGFNCSRDKPVIGIKSEIFQDILLDNETDFWSNVRVFVALFFFFAVPTTSIVAILTIGKYAFAGVLCWICNRRNEEDIERNATIELVAQRKPYQQNEDNFNV